MVKKVSDLSFNTICYLIGSLDFGNKKMEPFYQRFHFLRVIKETNYPFSIIMTLCLADPDHSLCVYPQF
jgi:hypothetical protein